MIKLDSIDQEGYLVMVTRQGIIKRTAISAFRNIRKSGLIALTIDEGDELAWVRMTSGANELIVATKNGMAIKFDENDVRPMGRTARGVKAITLEDGDMVIGMARVREGATLLTVSDKGLGRRSRLSDYRTQSRAGKGVTNYRVSDEKGYVAGVKVVDEDDDVIMITDGGVIIRIPVSQIPIHSRYSTGVKCMRVTDDTSVVTLARAPKEVEDDTEEEDTENPPSPEEQETPAEEPEAEE